MSFTTKIKRRLVLLFTGLLLLAACEEGIFKSGLQEGVIEYQISYPNLAEDHLMMDLLPKKMQCKFKPGMFTNEVSAGMGLFKSAVIYQSKEEHLYHTVKLLNTKIFAELDNPDILALNDGFENLEFKPTGNKQKIAGYNCKEVEVTVPSDSSWTFLMYYTKEIDIPEANFRNPFEEIDGVLMQYDIVSNGLRMRFSAKKVTEEKVPEDEIVVGEEYEKVSSSELRAELESIFNRVR